MEKNYNTVPNQKVVKVQKARADKNHLYSIINIEAAHRAMKDLADTKAGFMLWYYFAENQNGYEFALSSKAVELETGIKIKAYNSAIATLIDKGYLVNTQGNYYIFYEEPVILPQDNAAEEYIITENPVMLSEDNSYPSRAQRVMPPEDKSYPSGAQEIIQYYNTNTLNNTFYGEKESNVKNDTDKIEWLMAAKYGKDYINQDGKLLILATGELWDIPRINGGKAL